MGIGSSDSKWSELASKWSTGACSGRRPLETVRENCARSASLHAILGQHVHDGGVPGSVGEMPRGWPDRPTGRFRPRTTHLFLDNVTGAAREPATGAEFTTRRRTVRTMIPDTVIDLLEPGHPLWHTRHCRTRHLERARNRAARRPVQRARRSLREAAATPPLTSASMRTPTDMTFPCRRTKGNLHLVVARRPTSMVLLVMRMIWC